ncbi:MAG: RNA 2',3'-cyclic phosphodiesterase [Planctomycetes bacterium]|nr:RNA 2',3'-cyclic phosphodiesterase [Planctomycetota bacterium]
MVRLFVAVELPDEARERLLAMRPANLPSVRLVGRQEMHLTLHFVGEVENDHILVVRRALEKVKTPPFVVDVEGVGRFPEEGVPRVLWAGVRTSRRLLALYRAVGTTLAAAVGYGPEDRPYRPHVTLARLDEAPSQEDVEEYLEKHSGFQMAAIPITRFSLYSSVRIREGPRYELQATFDLSEAAMAAKDNQGPAGSG